MLRIGDYIQLSASDLVGHLYCRHLTGLDIAVAKGTLEKPKIWDPLLEILRERGARHEEGYVKHLRNSRYTVTVIDSVGVEQSAVSQTIDAMRAGSEIIVQGCDARRGGGMTIMGCERPPGLLRPFSGFWPPGTYLRIPLFQASKSASTWAPASANPQVERQALRASAT
jgi:hypothetical protein